jgi:hypothetical protein
MLKEVLASAQCSPAAVLLLLLLLLLHHVRGLP